MAFPVELRRTDELSDDQLQQLRAFLEDAFEGSFSEDDWGHALGGVHALMREDGELVAHGSVVARELMLGERPLRAGYVEAVAVRPDRRGHGYGTAVMDALERMIASDYEIGALAATDAAAEFYSGRDWLRWRGRTSVLTPVGAVRTREDDGGVWVFPLSYTLDPKRPLTCDWRPGHPW